MLRFCDSRVVASAVLNGELRDIVSAFLPAPVVVQASRPGGPEELPQLDIQFGQGLLEQPRPIRRDCIRQ